LADAVDVVGLAVGVQDLDEVLDEGLSVAQVGELADAAADWPQHQDGWIFRLHGVVELE